tara:strand:+ start:1527 stop:1895 length:369 start_codon:yes stop_codon:yes gene_type:complete
VRYNNSIRNIKDLKLIWPYIKKEAGRIITEEINILPSVRRKGDPYGYINGEAAVIKLVRIYHATIAHSTDENPTITIRDFLDFCRRLFIVSGLVLDDPTFYNFIEEKYKLATYLERNADEIY